MNRKLVPLLAVLAFAIAGSSASAQVWYRPPYASPYAYYPPAYGGNYYYGAGYSPVEGVQRGFASVLRGAGEAAESFSRARINNEEARSKYIDNKMKWTEMYWKRKRFAEAQRAQDYYEEQEKRLEWMASRRNRSPETLMPSQYNPQTGFIEWPEPLQDLAFADLRSAIEEQLQILSTSGTNANADRVSVMAREMQDLLRDRIREMPANDYIGARKFLDRLINQMAMMESETT